MTSDVPLRTPEAAAKTAERHNKKLAQRFPLLADQLDVVGAWTTEYVLQSERSWRERMDAVEQAAKERGTRIEVLLLNVYPKRRLPIWTHISGACCRRMIPHTGPISGGRG